MFLRAIIPLFLLFLFSAVATAGIQERSFSFSPMVGGQVFEGDQHLKDALFWSIGLGYNLTENAALEAVFSKAETDSEISSASIVRIQTLRIDALYHFNPERKLVPYLAVGLGQITSNPETGSSRLNFLVNAGGGLKYFLNKSVALRGDLRYLFEFSDPENNLLCSAGLEFQFGKPTPAPAPLPIVAPPITPVVTPSQAPAPLLDSDGDGVMDEKDRCPNTPDGVKVESNGCPIDSDSDGVVDYLDKCPDTPQGSPVDGNGCPLDSDGDGVLNSLDQCPETPSGVSVDSKGCTTKLTLRINFGLNSDQLGPEFDSEIGQAARCINDYPGNIVFIDGHTDSQGREDYNQKLSERRAAAVKNRLVEKFAVPAIRMTARGFGENQPVADNTTSEGRFLNRRVEVACGAAE